VKGDDFGVFHTPLLDAFESNINARTSCLWLSPSHAEDPARIRYIPLMAKVGHPFIDDCIDALDALVFGPGARDLVEPDSESLPQATDIADIDLNLFADPRSTSATGSPSRVHALVKQEKRHERHALARDNPGWRASVSNQLLGIHGNAVRDYLGADPSIGIQRDGKFLNREIVICAAQYNTAEKEGNRGSRWVSGVVYWDSRAGYEATSGPDAGKTAAPFITLGHELTHGWIDHFLDIQGNMPERYVLQTDWDIEQYTDEATGAVDYAGLRALWDPDGTSPYSSAEFQTLVNARIHFGWSIDEAESDLFIAPPMDLENPLYEDTKIVGYNEEEANTDLDFQTAHRAIEWAKKNNPGLLEEGGSLENFGNRSEYNEWITYAVQGPLSARRQD